MLENDILTIEYNKPIFNAEGLVLSEPEQFIIDKLNSCIKIRLDNRDIDFIHSLTGYFSYYNTKNETFYLNYTNIWSVLKNTYNYNDEEIKELSNNILLKVFKYKVTRITSYPDISNT